ncbi:ATP-dependent DNA helicase DDX11 isoform X2 [Anabrus simplex]|uniref:ATP-dependent DNA helicase DDX11 isoform X2 n=1 Tax=Anabrus simplex TaxID=316456 RepID=UPI0035A2C685
MNEKEALKAPDKFSFPFTPYPIQDDFMRHLYNALEEGKLGIFESPTGTAKEKNMEKFSRVPKMEGASLDEPGVDPDLDDLDILLEDCPINSDNDECSDPELEEDEEFEGTKVYFCSRTHSQLAQFVGEVQRSPYGKDIRLVSLASRQNYCINEAVQKLRNMSLINERCLDMQKKKKGRTTTKDADGKSVKKSRGATGCLYLNQQSIETLRDETLVDIHDVEQLVKRGQELSACPYYSSRSSVKDAQVVVVPYNTLLHKSTREACGIKLTGNIIIIDEAHNLLDTIGHIHSSEITGYQLTHAYSQLTQYRDRYQARFSAINLLHLNQIIFIVGKFIQMLGGKPDCNPTDSSRKGVDTKLYTLSDFVLTAEIDNLNLYNLLAFSQRSRITQKLHGFAERYQPSVNIHAAKPVQPKGLRAFLKEISVDGKNNAKQESPQSTPTPVRAESTSNNALLPVLSFMECLTNHSEDGRVLCARQATVGKGHLKYLLLNPAAHFSAIVKEARAVIVAGGTMQPIEEFRDQLFAMAGGNPERVFQFSCGHVIPPENILPIILSSGPSGKQLDFSYQARNSLATLNELGRVLQNVCNVVPAGMVCFFPSYEYEKLVFAHLEKTGTLQKLETKKKVFREPKQAGMVDQVLAEYASCIEQAKMNPASGSNGALLLSVVGGKLSEGLNFSDDLGRCVVVVGMPYPNIQSPELQEKMKYLNTHVSPTAGQRHYENLCMKAVNQSIGRAVRHKDDYSTVLLLDHRYARPQTRAALPSWIQRSLQEHAKFGPALGQLRKFFVDRRRPDI